ncbi:MAG TPA: GNAT family N-acetyltransferase [Ramlibacter sp.]|nr:GNAT family N-acetyltransferase [Ramlibacter sp.]
MANDYRIRPMTREEVGLAIDWAAAEGWNPGLNDAPCFYAADPRGFLMGYWGEEPVASISVVKYGADFGFLGFYIVKPAFRGRGLGFALWQAGMASLAGRNVGLDGVVAQQDNYRESGFTLAWRNIRHEGVGGGRVPADPRIVPLAALPFETVRAYDRLFFPADRGTFLQCWIAQPGSTAIGFMAGDRLEGYGVLRRCREGSKIGPLFANDPAIAESLFLALKASAGAGEKIYLDTPEANPQAVELARRHSMRVAFETARMYTKETPPLPMDRLYGVTTFELG